MLIYYFATAVKNAQLQADDDIIDKINYHYTSSMIIVFAMLVSAKQFIGDPIECWVPATFTDPMEQYVENYCWVQNTYPLSLTDSIPKDTTERSARQIGYYQWVPFVLVLKSLLFYTPRLIWRLFSWQSGLNVQTLVEMACESRLLDVESRQKSLRIITNHVEDTMYAKQEIEADSKGKKICCMGATVTCLYILVKVLYCVNIIGQIYLLNKFLDARDVIFGYHRLQDMLNNRDWEQTGHFPRVTMCDFEVKVLGNVHRHTVQCVLLINMFNEKLFLFLWFWYILLGVATTFSLLHWTIVSVSSSQRINFIGRYLAGLEGYRMVDSHALERFTLNFMRQDGVFLLRMVAMHGGDLVCCELAKMLWNNFCDKKENITKYEKKYRIDEYNLDL